MVMMIDDDDDYLFMYSLQYNKKNCIIVHLLFHPILVVLAFLRLVRSFLIQLRKPQQHGNFTI